jgi:hypothetical protein
MEEVTGSIPIRSTKSLIVLSTDDTGSLCCASAVLAYGESAISSLVPLSTNRVKRAFDLNRQNTGASRPFKG